jgi:hypothetical protein
MFRIISSLLSGPGFQIASKYYTKNREEGIGNREEGILSTVHLHL